MRKLIVLLLSFVLVIVSTDESLAQFNRKGIKKNNKRIASFRGKKNTFSKNKYNAVGFSLSALNYYGDIAPKPQRVSTDISFTRPAIGVSFMHRFGPRYSLIGQFMYGTLSGSDTKSASPTEESGKYRYLRNLSFRNRIKELSVVAYLDLFENQSTYISRVKWTPYVYLGVAGFLSNPEAQAPATDLNGTPLPEAGNWVKLRPLGTEGQYSALDPTDVNSGIKPYKTVQVAVPFGIGARIRLNEVIDLWADIGFRYTFTDYLDDVSKNYVNLDKLNSELARSLSYRTNELGPPTNPYTYNGYTVQAGYGSEFKDNLRGSKDDKDIYMVTSVRLTYILGATFHKAKFR